jgi:photosystem II stability/assembly factor-like uncharacterized protein
MRWSQLALLACLAVFAASAAPAQAGPVFEPHSGWFWGNPQPQGHSLAALDFDYGQGYAAGVYGTLLRTADGGETWDGIHSQVTPGGPLQILDADSVVLTSGACELFRSDDEGQSFYRLADFADAPFGCGEFLSALAFPNPSTGYVLREDGSALRTDDGGQTFSQIASVPGPQPPMDAFFTDADTGVVATGTYSPNDPGRIFRTTDGGQSWQEVANGPSMRDVVFVSGVGYAVGSRSAFLRSLDGGQTWTPQPLDGLSHPADFSSIDCIDATTCVMAQDFTRDDQLIRTADGGATAQSVFSSEHNYLHYVAFASPSRVVAVGETGATAISDDAGSTWRIQGTRFGKGDTVYPSGAVEADSDQLAHITQNHGTILRTIDGGLNWFAVTLPDQSFYVADATFPSEQVGYALDQGEVFETTDGGSTWQRLNVSSGKPPAAIFALDPERLLLAGPRRIRLSVDGGISFRTVRGRAPRSPTLVNIERAGGDVVMAHGAHAIYLSADGGSHWRRVPLPPRSKPVGDVDFLDTTIGYALTSSGFWKTTNGGRKWTDVPAVGTSGYAISFSTPEAGYMSVGGYFATHGEVYRTVDGGQTWQPQLVTWNTVTAVDAGATGYASTPYNDLLATKTGGSAGTPSSLAIRAERTGYRLQVSGRLNPAEGGEEILVSARGVHRSKWREEEVSANTTGDFSASFEIRRASYVVARWFGDGLRAGAGSPAIKVRFPKKGHPGH